MNGEQTLQEPTGDTPDEVRELFARCVLRQQDPRTKSPRELARQWLFEERKFASPLYAKATDPLIWKHLYVELVEQLRTADDVMFWYWLGQWFKSEGIRDPNKFLPAKVLNPLTQELGISGADIRNAGAVRIWLPYTEPLVRKTRWLRQENANDPGKQLEELGYDSAAVEVVTSKRWGSPVEYTCEWVALRTSDSSKKYERETLVNSYSRYFGRWWVRVNRCSFCGKEPDGEFWAREKSIPYCQEHAPDKLPRSENAAWPDRIGRRWWRENLDIRCTVPGASL